MTNANAFKIGDRVRHRGRNECGTVTDIDFVGVRVLFDNPTPRGNPSVGLYDERWFEMYPGMLVAEMEQSHER